MSSLRMRKRIMPLTIAAASVLILIVLAMCFYPVPKYSLRLEVAGLMGHDVITIDEEGNYVYDLENYMKRETKSYAGKLSEKDMKDLGRYIRNCGFFVLPKDMSRDTVTCQDQENLIITWRGKEYTCEGYNVGNPMFRAIVKKIEGYREKFDK